MATATPEQIIASYQLLVGNVRDRVERYAATVWRDAGSWRDDDVDRLVALIVPRVQAGQIQTAQLTAAFLASVETVRTGTPAPTAVVDRASVTEVRGVPQEELYRRPAASMYAALSQGATMSAALESGLARLQSLVATDHQLAKTNQSRASMTGRGFTYMRRTLTGRENCALCAIASTQRYRVQDLLPIHPGCDCGTDTVHAGSDPGQVLDESLLEQIHAMVDAEFGGTDRGARILDGLNERSDFLDLVTVREHGELGPVLTWRDQHFTSKADIAALN